MRVLVIRGRRASLLLVWERSGRLLVHEGFTDSAVAIRAKAISGLLASQNRGHVSIAISSDM